LKGCFALGQHRGAYAELIPAVPDKPEKTLSRVCRWACWEAEAADRVSCSLATAEGPPSLSKTVVSCVCSCFHTSDPSFSPSVNPVEPCRSVRIFGQTHVLGSACLPVSTLQWSRFYLNVIHGCCRSAHVMHKCPSQFLIPLEMYKGLEVQQCQQC